MSKKKSIGITQEAEPRARNVLKTTSSRVRQFWIRTYIHPLDVEQFLKTEPWIQHWATCYHNQDFDSNHLPKEPHSHILLYTYDGKTVSAVQRRFDGLSRELYPDNPQQTYVDVCTAPIRAYRYLIHADETDEGQHLYASSERHTDDRIYWLKFVQTDGMNGSHNVALSMFQDMKKGTKTVTMLERYGMNFARMRGNIQNLVEQDYYETRSPEAYTRPKGISYNEYATILQNDVNCPFTAEDIARFRRMCEYAETIIFLNEERN